MLPKKQENIFRTLLDILKCLENDLDQVKSNYAYSKIDDAALAANIDDAIMTAETLRNILQISEEAQYSKQATQAIFLDANNMPLIIVNLDNIRENDND